MTPMHWRSLSYISTTLTPVKAVASTGVNRFETPQAPRASSPQFDWTFAEDVEEVGEKIPSHEMVRVK